MSITLSLSKRTCVGCVAYKMTPVRGPDPRPPTPNQRKGRKAVLLCRAQDEVLGLDSIDDHFHSGLSPEVFFRSSESSQVSHLTGSMTARICCPSEERNWLQFAVAYRCKAPSVQIKSMRCSNLHLGPCKVASEHIGLVCLGLCGSRVKTMLLVCRALCNGTHAA